MEHVALWGSFLAGALVVLVLLPPLNRLALRLGAVARVRADRWHQDGVIPRLAGPALYVALSPWLDGDGTVVLGGFCLIGCVDDLHSLPAGIKAIALLVPAAMAAWLTGQLWLLPALWFTANAVNLLDHADGVVGASLATTLAASATPAGLAGGGGCLAFLFFNFPPARCFLGDGGSMMLGAAAIWVWWPAGPITALAWCAVPLADAVAVTIRRIATGRKPWVGGIDHSAHALLRRGVPPWQLPFLYGAITASIGVVVAGVGMVP